MTTRYLACDLGAESGRLILGTLNAGHLDLLEIHRFPNTPVLAENGMHWNIPVLLDNLADGLKRLPTDCGPIASISADSWGVDYILFDKSGRMMEPVFHYRDSRTSTGLERTFSRISRSEIFNETGIQHMPINTNFQLASESSARLDQASLILGVADAFNYFLGGKPCFERSLASTTQLYNPLQDTWSSRLLNALQLPSTIFPGIVPSGTLLGPLAPHFGGAACLRDTQVIATCSHDTGAAVAAVPATGNDWAYISSGTWSLLGVERSAPLLTDECRELNFTNEMGHDNTTRLLKNIVGLWIVQECRRAWAAAGNEMDYAQLSKLAADAGTFSALINPGDPRFLSPGDMPEKIAAFCRETGQTPPIKPGAVIRCILESLALLYRRTLKQVETLTQSPLRKLHIVGGGARNSLLNQFTASATGIPVLAGPVEATAAGNVLIQAIALGHVSDLAEARRIVQHSFQLETFQPRDTELWQSAIHRFNTLLIP